MSQFEQENDLGEGGGEVSEETEEAAWSTAAERLGDESTEELGEEGEP